MKTCLVLGAGMSGLMAARRLQAEGVTVTVLDKGRGVGGRLATRHIEEGVFDHGAQFITVREPAFDELMGKLLAAGVTYEWCRGIGTPGEPQKSDGHPRYQGTGGMVEIAKHLSRGLDVRIRHRVTQLNNSGGQWHAHSETGQTVSADALISTAPVPQALDLLDLGGFEMPDENRAVLDGIKYHPCLAVMALLEGPSQLPEPGAFRDASDSISFVCDNKRKGISPQVTAVTIHGTPSFSRDHWSVEEKVVVDWLLAQAAPYLGSPVRSATLHRWRYSQPMECHTERCLQVGGRVNGFTPLVFAGDAFDGPRVEGAALSGIAAAEALLRR